MPLIQNTDFQLFIFKDEMLSVKYLDKMCLKYVQLNVYFINTNLLLSFGSQAFYRVCNCRF